MELAKCLYTGTVYHKRFLPKSHSLRHRVYFIKFQLDQLNKLSNYFFSVDSWNLLSFWHQDHGTRKDPHLKAWIEKKLNEAGISTPPNQISLMTFPRVLGFVFNPVSFWFCYQDEKLLACIAEVNNTFGGTDTYVIQDPEKIYDKKFHVSPFFKIEGYYKFTFNLSDKDRIFVGIDYYQHDVCYLKTYITGRAQELSSKNVLKVWLSHPLMTFAVVFWIHWHALKLYLKKIPFYGTKGV